MAMWRLFGDLPTPAFGGGTFPPEGGPMPHYPRPPAGGTFPPEGGPMGPYPRPPAGGTFPPEGGPI